MAGDWIKMRGNLWDDPRVARLCDLTDQSEAAVVGALYWLWATADQHTEDGVMPGLTLRQIDRKTGIQGIGQALCDVGWLADQPGGVQIVKFQEHNGSSAKRRASEAQRKANDRKPSASHADKTRTDAGQSATDCGAREEKRRVNTVPNGTDAAGASAGKTASETRKAEAWAGMKSLLNEHGMPKAQTGAFISKLKQDFGEQIVIAAMESAVVARPAEPEAYLKATCQSLAGQRSKAEPQWRVDQRNRTQQAAPGVAEGGPADQFFIDVEARNVAPRLVG